MASEDDAKKTPGGKKTSEEDLDKTMVDVRIREGKPEKDEDIGDFDETVMVPMPPAEEEPGLHEDELLREEKTGKTDLKSEKLKEKEKLEAKQKKQEKKESKKKAKEKKRKAKIAKPPVPPTAAAVPVFSLSYFVLNLIVFLFLAGGLLETLRTASPLRFPVIVATGFAFLCLGGSFLRRIESKSAFLWATVAWFAWFSYAAFIYYTSQTTYFLNFSLGQVLGLFVTFLAGVVALILWRAKEVSFLSKIPGLLGFVIVALAFLFSLFSGRSLEGNLWGPGLATALPLALRPGILALMVSFPLLALSVLLAMPGWSKMGKGLIRGPAVPLLLLCLMGSILGAKVLARQGITVPFLGKLVGEGFLGSTLLDPSQTSIKLILAEEKSDTGVDSVFPLTVSASLPVAKEGSERSQLLVRNPEGRPFARHDLSKFMTLMRGDLKMKGGLLKLEEGRLGQPRTLVLLIDLPSLMDPQVQTSLTGAVFHLAHQLNTSDKLFVAGAGGLKKVASGNEKTWKKTVDSALKGDTVNVPELMTRAYKKIANLPGYKQLLLITSAEKLPPAPKRGEWINQSKKGKVVLSFLALGSLKAEEPGVYQAAIPAALGFELLSAAATTLGDYRLQYPKLPPLPKISMARTPEGQAQIRDGRIHFEILSANADDIEALRFRIDNEQPIDLDPKQLNQTVNLERYKVLPGKHQFSIQLITKAGDEVLEKFSADYVTKRPLQFVKPLEKDTIGGVYNVMLSPARVPGLTVQAIDLFVDGIPSAVVTTEPYLISLDTTQLGPGEHKLQAVQTFSDGKTESVALTVNVNPSAPMVKIVRPSNGEFISNLAEIEAEVGGGLLAQIQKVDYYVDGQWIGESNQAPHRFLWSNHDYPAGKYFIQARAQLESQNTTTDAVQVQLAQGEVVVQADPVQNPSGELYPDNVEVLLDASTSMKEPLGGSLKMDIAKSSLVQLSNTLPENVKIITRVFGGGPPGFQEACKDSVRLKKPKDQLPGVSPRGTSPLAYALNQMKKDLNKTQGSRIGLLITDGWDRCGEDPIEVAQNITKSQKKVRLQIIYFSDISPTEESLLKRLAEVTGGRTFKVRRPEDLLEATRDAVHVNFSLYDYKNTPVISQPLSAEPFQLRTGEYRLEVDTVPPLTKEALKVPSGVRKTFQVVQEGEQYQLQEK